MDTLTITALAGIPEVRAGDEPAQLLADALRPPGAPALTGESVVVVAHKLISKAEGRTRALSGGDGLRPRARARRRT